jgi:hypothetical protein
MTRCPVAGFSPQRPGLLPGELVRYWLRTEWQMNRFYSSFGAEIHSPFLTPTICGWYRGQFAVQVPGTQPHPTSRTSSVKALYLHSQLRLSRFGEFISATKRRNLFEFVRKLFLKLVFCVGIEVLTAVIMKSTIFWDITPCSPLSVNRRFAGTYRLHLHGQRNNFSKVWGSHRDGYEHYYLLTPCSRVVNFYRTTQHHIPEYITLHVL